MTAFFYQAVLQWKLDQMCIRDRPHPSPAGGFLVIISFLQNAHQLFVIFFKSSFVVRRGIADPPAGILRGR